MSFIRLFIFLSVTINLGYVYGQSCEDYESYNFWPNDPVKRHSSVMVEVCCNKDNPEHPPSPPSIRTIQIKLKVDDTIKITDLKKDPMGYVIYQCDKGSSIYQKCVPSFVSGRMIDSGGQKEMPLRIYHKDPPKGVFLVQTNDSSGNAYYGFQVLKGGVEIKGIEKAERICSRFDPKKHQGVTKVRNLEKTSLANSGGATLNAKAVTGDKNKKRTPMLNKNSDDLMHVVEAANQ